MGRRVISFSLWGTDPVYTAGALRNAELAPTVYPGWTCVFHAFDSVPAAVVGQLERMPHCEVHRVPGTGDNRGMFARFLSAADAGADHVIFRDTDSRLSPREKLAVDAWIADGRDLHVMRDHPHHRVPMMGGMWGVRGGVLHDIGARMEAFRPTNAKGQDQLFLGRHVWGLLWRGLTACVHDPFFARESFPSGSARGPANAGIWFIGEAFDAHDRTTCLADIRHLLASERLEDGGAHAAMATAPSN